MSSERPAPLSSDADTGTATSASFILELRRSVEPLGFGQPSYALVLGLAASALGLGLWAWQSQTNLVAAGLLIILTVAAFFERRLLRQRFAKLETGRIVVERQVDTHTQYFDALISHSPLATVVLGPDARVQLCNPAFEKLFQISQAEAVGNSLDELIADPAHLAEAAEYNRQVLAGRSVHMTATRQRRDRSLVEVEVYGVPLEAKGQLIGIYALYQDVTDRVRGEQALRESEERFRRLADATFEGIVVSDDGRILDCNEQYARLYLLSQSQMIGRSIYDFITAEHRAIVKDKVTRQVEQVYEHKAVRADGSTFLAEVHGRSVQQAGRIVRVTAVRDITDHRRFEEEVRQAQKMEAVGRLAGGIAHDFNNVLTVIKGYSQLVAMQLPEGRLRAQVEEIRQASERATLMTQRLLAFGRKQPLQPQVLDLNAVILGMEKILRRLIRSDIAFDLRLAPDLGSIQADPGQIEQVILNLAINAGDAMPRGGILQLETKNLDALPVAGDQGGPAVQLLVADNGTGMDEETKRQLFEPFFTTKQKGKGTGLGLATVYSVVTQSNGTIEVESSLGRGTIFRVYLPRIHQPNEPTVEKGPVGELQRGSERVLVVEDEAAVRSLAVEFLRRHGFQVFEADNGKSALELIKAEKLDFDMVLTDVVMPGMNGPELVRELKRERPTLRVLFMSGYTDDVLNPEEQLERYRLIQKPFLVEDLIAKVRETLDETASRVDIERPSERDLVADARPAVSG